MCVKNWTDYVDRSVGDALVTISTEHQITEMKHLNGLYLSETLVDYYCYGDVSRIDYSCLKLMFAGGSRGSCLEFYRK